MTRAPAKIRPLAHPTEFALVGRITPRRAAAAAVSLMRWLDLFEAAQRPKAESTSQTVPDQGPPSPAKVSRPPARRGDSRK